MTKQPSLCAQYMGLIWGHGVLAKRHALTKSVLSCTACVCFLQWAGYYLFVGSPQRWLIDVGLASTSFVIHLCAIGLPASIYARLSLFGSESLVWSRAVSKTTWFLSTYITTVCYAALCASIPYAFTWFLLGVYNHPIHVSFWIQPPMLFLEACTIAAVALFFIAWIPQGRSTVYTLATLLAGHHTENLYTLSVRWEEKKPLLGHALKYITHLLPNMEKISLRIHAANTLPISRNHIQNILCYHSAYIVLLLLSALYIFKKRYSLKR
jgi:hypothetical protein